jgi:hypothetical protein
MPFKPRNQTSSPAGNQDAITKLFMAMAMKGANTPSELIAVYNNFLKIPELSADEKKAGEAKKKVKNAIDLLEKKYYGGQTNPKLAYGRAEGLLQTLKSRAMDNGNPELRAYEGLVKSIRPALVKAMGDTGNLSETEQQAAIAGLPSAYDTPEEAKLKFETLKQKFDLIPIGADPINSLSGLDALGSKYGL